MTRHITTPRTKKRAPKNSDVRGAEVVIEERVDLERGRRSFAEGKNGNCAKPR